MIVEKLKKRSVCANSEGARVVPGELAFGSSRAASCEAGGWESTWVSRYTRSMPTLPALMLLGKAAVIMQRTSCRLSQNQVC